MLVRSEVAVGTINIGIVAVGVGTLAGTGGVMEVTCREVVEVAGAAGAAGTVSTGVTVVECSVAGVARLRIAGFSAPRRPVNAVPIFLSWSAFISMQGACYSMQRTAN